MSKICVTMVHVPIPPVACFFLTKYYSLISKAQKKL